MLGTLYNEERNGNEIIVIDSSRYVRFVRNVIVLCILEERTRCTNDFVQLRLVVSLVSICWE